MGANKMNAGAGFFQRLFAWLVLVMVLAFMGLLVVGAVAAALWFIGQVFGS